MTSNSDLFITPIDPSALLEKALEKSQDVKEKMVDCATDLATVNETLKTDMAADITLKQAKAALIQTESVEEKVQECADELHEINESLAQEIGDRNELNRELKETQRKLFATKDILSNTEGKLAIAHKVAEEATRRTMRDYVTGIPNRELFHDRLEQATTLAERNGWILGVMFIDLDKFKLINDMHGHDVGDRVLQEVAKRLNEQVRSGDTVCRYGGDEFLCLLVNPQSNANIKEVAGKILNSISKTMVIDDLTLIIRPSIGIAVYPNNGHTGQELVGNADAAMYHAKKTKTGCVFFDDVTESSDGGVA